MAFWSELIAQGIEKGKTVFKGGKAALTSPGVTETLFKGAKVTGHYAASGAKKVISGTKTTVGWAGNIGDWASKHPKTSIAGLAIALPHFGYDKGLLSFAMEKVGGSDGTKKGIAGVAADKVLGVDKDVYGNDKSISERAVNAMFGNGSYDNLKDAGGAVVDEGSNLYYAGKGAIGSIAAGARDLYYDGRDMVAGTFAGNGMVANGSGGYADPTTQQYPGFAQYAVQQGGGGMLSGLMGGMNSAVDSVSGGNVSKMNIATLLLSAYMMFGRFGWLGKAASLMLGGMTLKNINNHQTATMQQNMQQSPMQPAVATAPQYATYEPTASDNSTVRMTRSL